MTSFWRIEEEGSFAVKVIHSLYRKDEDANICRAGTDPDHFAALLYV